MLNQISISYRSPVDNSIASLKNWLDHYKFHVAAFAASIFVSLVFIKTDGNFFWGSVLIGAAAITLVTFYNLEWGFLILVGLVIVSDRFDVTGFRPFTYTIFYLSTLNVMIRGLGFGVLTSMEIHTLLFIFVWILVAAIKKNRLPHPVPLGRIAVLLLVYLVGSVMYGRFRGGDTQIGIWEIRALVLLAPTFLAVPQMIKNKENLQKLVWVVIAALSFKAFQGIERFVGLGFSFGRFRTLMNHEDPLFFAALFIFLLAMIMFGSNHPQRRVLLWLLVPLLIGFYVANRRAGYAVLGLSVIPFVALLSKADLRKALRILVVPGFIFCVYLAAYWDSYGRVAMVAQAFKSALFSHDREAVRGDDYMSGLTRDHEVYNLAVTVRKAPILGIGFGNQHEWAIPAFGMFALKGYITHNSILWLITKTGGLGFFLFFFFLNCTVLYGAMVFSRLEDPYLKAVCAVSIVAIFNQIVGGYAEMQLINSRNMVFLGLFMGIIPTIDYLNKNGSVFARQPGHA